jgi:ferric-dicitrate binding protein FerR (iron transport regulator)
MHNNSHIPTLILKYLREDISDSEREELERWINEHEYNRELFRELTQDASLQQKLRQFIASDKRVQQEVYNRLGMAPVVPFYQVRKRRWGWMAAASVVLLISAGIFYFRNGSRSADQPVVVRTTPAAVAIQPGGNKATLTLDDGRVVDLNTTSNGLVSEQGQSKVIKQQNGVLSYEAMDNRQSPTGNGQQQISYNTLSTPRGGQYQLTLPDGTRMWLNAVSSIKYPTLFAGNERRVEVSGEVYFEVAKDASKPFHVVIFPLVKGEKANGDIMVLGTHFNVNAYGDEQPVIATLLEGKIAIDNGGTATPNRQSKIITPGQQAVVDKQQQIKVKSDADTEAAIAWMKGFFDFQGADIQHVMQQVSRWYNVDVQFASAIPELSFDGNIDRNIPLSDVLDLLQKMGKVHFRIEGRTVTVTE